jgi:hypothetical protein
MFQVQYLLNTALISLQVLNKLFLYITETYSTFPQTYFAPCPFSGSVPHTPIPAALRNKLGLWGDTWPASTMGYLDWKNA